MSTFPEWHIGRRVTAAGPIVKGHSYYGYFMPVSAPIYTQPGEDGEVMYYQRDPERFTVGWPGGQSTHTAADWGTAVLPVLESKDDSLCRPQGPPRRA